MEEAGLSQVDLARACGVKPPSVHGWLSGKAKFLRGENLLLAARALNVNQEWLATGAGPMRLSEVRPDPLLGLDPGTFMRVHGADQDDPTMTQIRRVKIKVQAGITGFQVEPEHYDGETQGVPTKWMLKEGLSKDALVSTTVRGESMEPALYDGDVIVVNTRDTQLVSGAVYVINYEGEAVVKRMLRDAGQWWLTSDNSDQRKYHRQLCKGAECIVIGRVVRKESTHI
jgi:phage repressor protein C with HTH and peptisase S24 domain